MIIRRKRYRIRERRGPLVSGVVVQRGRGEWEGGSLV